MENFLQHEHLELTEELWQGRFQKHNMEVRAVSKSVRVSPRKIRLVADVIRRLPVDEALGALSLLKKRGSDSLEKTLKSAIANATNNANLKREDLVIKSIDVLDAPSLKRYHPSTKGRAHPYKRKGSHVIIVLEDGKKEEISQEEKVKEDK